MSDTEFNHQLAAELTVCTVKNESHIFQKRVKVSDSG